MFDVFRNKKHLKKALHLALCLNLPGKKLINAKTVAQVGRSTCWEGDKNRGGASVPFVKSLYLLYLISYINGRALNWALKEPPGSRLTHPQSITNKVMEPSKPLETTWSSTFAKVSRGIKAKTSFTHWPELSAGKTTPPTPHPASTSSFLKDTDWPRPEKELQTPQDQEEKYSRVYVIVHMHEETKHFCLQFFSSVSPR